MTTKVTYGSTTIIIEDPNNQYNYDPTQDPNYEDPDGHEHHEHHEHHHHHHHHTGQSSGTSRFMDFIEGLPLPPWVKSLIRDSVYGQTGSRHGPTKIKMERLPSESSAAKTISDFQKNQLNGEMLTSEQMDQMARTGYLTKKDGTTIKVSPDVQEAAKRFMANDAELFKKLESANTGTYDGLLSTGDYDKALHDGKISANDNSTQNIITITYGEHTLPSEANAAKTMCDFQSNQLGGEMLTAEQMDQMARTGYLTKKDGTTIKVSPDVQEAAKRFMANGGELFKKVESATTGSYDGLLSSGDYYSALRAGKLSRGHERTVVCVSGGDDLLPSAADASQTIQDFQKNQLNGEMLTSEQMDQMARTGYLTKKDGTTIKVSPEVQAAAQRFMANDADLFKKIESATTDSYDGLLSVGDHDKAREKHLMPTEDDDDFYDVICHRHEHTRPSESSAAKTIHDFQQRELNGEMLTAEQMDQMARTGYLTKKDGTTIKVSPDVQAAAQRFMANGAELFKKIESANTGSYDGVLSTYDYDMAISGGKIPKNGPKREVVYDSGWDELPSAGSAAKTIRDFQKNDLDGELLSAEQVDQMARTGYLTKKDGTTIKVSPDVQDAAKRLMANGGKLFQQLEAANTGSNDGLLGLADYDKALDKGIIPPPDSSHDYIVRRDEYYLPSASSAAKTIRDFQKNDLDGELLSAEQIDQMARTGYLTKKDGTTIKVSPDVQDAAKRLMANGGELFQQLESANTGSYDGLLGLADYDKALDKGIIRPHSGSSTGLITDDSYFLPSASSAAQTMENFQKNDLDGELLSAEQVDQMARTGYLTKKDGTTIKVSPEVQDAAKRLMANGGELFQQLEAANTGSNDGLLGLADYDKARDKGILSNADYHHYSYDSGFEDDDDLPSPSMAAKTIKDFQKNDLDGELLSAEQVDQMARTGYLTKKDGTTIKVSPEVQAAAQRLMANGGELFQQLESANTGSYDGLLGLGDYDPAAKKGVIYTVS